MSDHDPFTEQQNTGQPPVTSSPDVFADQLSLIKNENGEPKYKDVPAALEALAHSQEFIRTLRMEKANTDLELERYKKEAETRASVESLLDKFVNKQGQEPQQKVDQPNASELDESKVKALIENTLRQQSVAQVLEGNLQKVVSALSDKFGETARTVIAERAKELGTTPDALRDLAKQNPSLVLALFGDINPVSKQNTPPSSVHLPPKTGLPELEKPARSVMRGGMTDKELAAEFRRVAEHTRKKLGVVG